jgi:hypothetical protein
MLKNHIKRYGNYNLIKLLGKGGYGEYLFFIIIILIYIYIEFF